MQLLLEFTFVLSLALLFYIGWRMFRDLADLSQWVVRTSRENTMWTFYNRHKLAVAMLAVGAIAAASHFFGDAGHWLPLLLGIGFAAFGFGVGYVNPGFMMRSQQHNPRYFSVAKAKEVLNPDTSLIVVETKAGARGHPDHHILRPHVAGLTHDSNDEDEMVLTYCGLSNLGIAFVPEVNGKKLDLKVMTQLENNLVMWDRNSGEPIQQIWGRLEGDGPNGPTMPERASYRMPLWAFEKTFPDGKVFLNPIVPIWKNPLLGLYDRIMHMVFIAGVTYQAKKEKPTFPTIDNVDDRLPNKELVYAANVGDDYVAWTTDFIKQNGGVMNIRMGDRDIVVAYHKEQDSVGMYVNTSGKPVQSIEFGGQSDQGLLPRLETMKAAVFWIVWQNFFPQTEVNRAPLAA